MSDEPLMGIEVSAPRGRGVRAVRAAPLVGALLLGAAVSATPAAAATSGAPARAATSAPTPAAAATSGAPRPAAAPRCGAAAASATRIGPPTARLAWRAELVGVTPVRAYIAHERSDLPAIDPATAAAVLVLDARVDALGRCWLKVRLPTRPNTAAGWINAQRALVRPTPWRIVVSRAERTVTLLHAGARAARIHAVIGTSGTPTPTGLFAVASVWANPAGDFLGSWILPLSAHSRVLQTFDGGDGRVALHGRGGASLQDALGSAASHGCVRLANADISALVHRIGAASLPGTPVRIQ